MRRLAVIAIVTLLLVAGGVVGTASGTTDTGDTHSEAPVCSTVSYDSDGETYLVENVSQLQCIDDTGLGENYRLVDDINASWTEGWNDGDGFDPIGNASDPFTGIFNGNGHTIDGLYIDRPSENEVALFGGATRQINNITLANASVTGDSRVGLVAGRASTDLDVFDVHAEGTVNGSGDTGGVVGSVDGGGLALSSSSADVTVLVSDAGGNSVGALVGWANEGTIADAYATGTVEVDDADNVGGLVGNIGSGSIQRTFVAVDVETTTVTHSGAFLGSNTDDIVSDSYWDSTVASGEAVGEGGNSRITGLSTTEMQGERPLGEMVPLGFYDSWVATEGYPDVFSSAGVEGDGSADSPYTVANAYQLQSLEKKPDAEYELIDDIDANDTTDWNSGDGFNPIGDNAAFTGTFDGQGYTIDGLTIERSSMDDVGLFGNISNTATVTNVSITSADITGHTRVGVIVGLMHNAGDDGQTVTNVSTEGTVTAEDKDVGGLVGTNNGEGRISSSGANVSVVAQNGTGSTGGLIGWGENAIISDSYAYGTVSGGDRVGGLAGHHIGSIKHSYAAGDVSGGTDQGGLVGKLVEGDEDGTLENSYWDNEATGESDAVGTDGGGSATVSDVMGLPTEDMQGEAAEDKMTNFGFETTWTTVTFPDQDYPRLQWEPIPFAVDNTNAFNPSGQDIVVQFDTSQEIESVSIDIGGAESGSLDEDDFEQIDEGGDGDYTYRGTYEGSSDGTYDVTFDRIEDENRANAAEGERRSVRVRTEPPEIHDFRINESGGSAVEVTIVADEKLYDRQVEIEDSESVVSTLSGASFIQQAEDGNYTYTAEYSTEGEDTYTATLTAATDDRGNDAADDQTDNVEISSSDGGDEGSVRVAERGDNVFLGGDYFELGIRPDGGFGAETTAPSEFFGSLRSEFPSGQIGIYADVDGFYNDAYDYRYEYFLPGSPEERWSVGYTNGDDTEKTESAGRTVYSSDIDTTLSEASDDTTARAHAESNWEDLEIDQTFEFEPDDRYYRTTVTITNTGDEPVDDVRYQRSFDPDNGKDVGCSYATNNTVHNQYPQDGNSLVSASLMDSASCDITEVSDIPFFYYSTDKDARVSHGDFGLTPPTPPFGEQEWDNAPEPGASHDRDTYIAVTFNAGTLDKDDEVTYTYYSGLSDDFDTTVSEVEKSAGDDTEVEPPTADAGEDQDVSTETTVRFNASETSGNLSIERYEWDFDDGTTATGESPTHRFTDAGEYNVSLTVTDAGDETDVDNLTVTVSEPPGIELSGGSKTFRDTKEPVAVDEDLTVTGDELSGATVSIEGGFDVDEDELEAVDSHDDISSSYNADTGVLTLAGDADASDYETVLRSVTYTNTADDPDETDREISFTLGTNTVYSESTGHYYRYVEDEGILWEDAREAADSQDQFGLDGSLATITSEKENRFLLDRYESAGWLGATDVDEEGVWRWVTGPEGEEADGDGRHFFTQAASHTGTHRFAPEYPRPPKGVPGGGEAVDDSYENWDRRNQPNNKWPMFGGQDYAYFCYDTRACTDGSWKDLNGTHSGEPTPQGYFVQFGGLADDPDVTLSETTSVAVVRDQPPVADAGSDIEADENAEIGFSASRSDDDFAIDEYHWDFGDDDSATGESPTHTYTTDGTYTVELTVTDDADQASVDLLTVTVIDTTVLIANPGANKTVDEGSVFEMDGSGSEASEGIDSYEWEFGDGTASGEQPTYVYNDPGEYEVTLTVIDTEGNKATAPTQVTVEDVTAPDADAGTDETVDEDETVTLDASSSTDNVDIDSYEWDTTGDGRVDTTGEENTTSYSDPGEYEVSLSVTDTSGNIETDSMTVTVEDTTDPTADAGGNVSVDQGERVEFDGTNSTDNDAIEDISWDFDDDEEATGSEVVHRFSDVRNHTVEMTVTDRSGNTATDTLTVNITASPKIETSAGEATFVESTDPVVVDEDLTVTYASDGDLEGAEVIIGDGFESGDELNYNESLANSRGISGNYDESTGVLSFDGTTKASTYQQVLRTVTYEFDGTEPREDDRMISYSIGTGGVYFTETGHYYEYVEDSEITWHDARDAASNRTHQGQQGYLATVTSAEENDFILDKLQGGGWLGASDAAEEGTWRWVTGPEGQEASGDGRHFFTQSASDNGYPDVYDGSTPGGGEAVDDDYENWDRAEPNDYRDGEDYAHFCHGNSRCPDGTWNDFAHDTAAIDGYVIEYGGIDGDTENTASDNRTVTVTRDVPPTAAAGSDLEVGTSDQIELNGSKSTDDFGIESYQWTFGDGNTSTGESTVHSYGSDGDYTVELEVFDTASQTDTDTLSVTVIDGSILVANAGSNSSIDEGETVELDGSASETSAGGIDYEWDIGANGSIDGTDETITHTYNDPGEYPVNLTINDTLGNTSTTTTYVEVADTTPPEASIDGAETQTVDNGTAVVFNASSTTPTYSEIDSYEWDFSDNDRTDATGENATHTFAAPGEYDVTLTVTDESGNVDTTSVTIDVDDINAPTAVAGEDRIVQAGQTVTFDGSDSEDDVAIDAFEWDFGEGTTSTEMIADHSYSTDDQGDHEVILTATDPSGNEGTDSITVTVENTDPSLSNLRLENPEDFNLSVSFDSDQPIDALSVEIDGPERETLDRDSFTETETSGTYTYESTYEGDSPGEYTATVIEAEDAIGNNGAADQNDTVRTLDAQASARSYTASVGTTIELDGSRSYVPEDLDPTFNWDLTGDDETDATGEAVSHEFTTPGENEVTLSLETEDHTVTDTVTVEITDRDNPVVRLDAGETVENNSNIEFDASGSTDDVAIEEFEWEFGDGTTESGSELNKTTHAYTTPGTYTVAVTASDAADNTETNSTTVTVLGPLAEVSTTALDYGNTPVGASNSTSLHITNDGTTPLSVTSADITGDDSGQFSLTGSAASDLPVISPGRSAGIGVEYGPDAVDDHSATLELETNHTDTDIDLDGSGVDSDLEALDTSRSFEDTDIDDVTTADIELSNSGDAPANLDAVSIVGSDAGQFGVESTPDSIEADETAPITVAFEPTVPGEQTATLRVRNGTGATTATVPLNGTGVGPSLRADDGGVDFGDIGVGVSSADTIELANDGNAPLNIRNVSFEGSDAEQFEIESQPGTVGPDGTETFQIAFEPDQEGTFESTLVVETNATDSPARLSVNGTGEAAKIDADPRSVNFEDVEVGQTVDKRIQVRNKRTSKTDLEVGSTSLSGADADEFAVENGGAPFTLSPGQTRQINVSFTPTSTEDKSTQLQIMSDAGNEPQINVWLSSSDSYIVVQEVATDDGSSSSTVNMDAFNVDVDSTLAVNVSQPNTRTRPVGFDEVSMTTLSEEYFEIDSIHDLDAPAAADAESYDQDGETTLQHVRLNHSVDSETNYTDTSVTYRVQKDDLSTDDPDEIDLNRWNETRNEWVEMDTTLIRESNSHYVFKSETPGFSQFAISEPESSSDSGETDKTSPGGSTSSVSGDIDDSGSDDIEDSSSDDTDDPDGIDDSDETDSTDDTAGDTDTSSDDGTGGITSIDDTGEDASSDGKTDNRADETVSLFGLTMSPELAWSLGGLSILSLVSAALLVGRQRSKRYLIAIGSDVDQWGRLAASAALNERDDRDLGEPVDIVAVSTDYEVSMTDDQRRILDTTDRAERDELAAVSVAELRETECNCLVWLGEPPADLDADIELVQWPLPELDTESDETAAVDYTLTRDVASLFDRFE